MRIITPTLVTLAVVFGSREAEADVHHSSKANRFWGLGWGTGYHVHTPPATTCGEDHGYFYGVPIEAHEEPLIMPNPNPKMLNELGRPPLSARPDRVKAQQVVRSHPIKTPIGIRGVGSSSAAPSTSIITSTTNDPFTSIPQHQSENAPIIGSTSGLSTTTPSLRQRPVIVPTQRIVIPQAAAVVPHVGGVPQGGIVPATHGFAQPPQSQTQVPSNWQARQW